MSIDDTNKIVDNELKLVELFNTYFINAMKQIPVERIPVIGKMT